MAQRVVFFIDNNNKYQQKRWIFNGFQDLQKTSSEISSIFA